MENAEMKSRIEETVLEILKKADVNELNEFRRVVEAFLHSIDKHSSHRKLTLPHCKEKTGLNFDSFNNYLTSQAARVAKTVVTMPQRVELDYRGDTEEPVFTCKKTNVDLVTPGVKELRNRVDRLMETRRDIIDFDILHPYPQTAMVPMNFEFPKMDQYNGEGCPGVHILMYMKYLQPLGFGPELLTAIFIRSLTGTAINWLVNTDPTKISTWPDLVESFVNWFSYGIERTRRHLDLEQGDDESFTEFITRWMKKASEVVHHPSDEELISMVLKNLNCEYASQLCLSAHKRFHEFVKVGIQVEDALASGQIPRLSQQPYQSVIHVRDQGEAHGYPQVDQQQGAARRRQRRQRRQFTELGYPLSKLLPGLLEKGLVKLLTPRPLPQPLPRGSDPNARCEFHQGPGHWTDSCKALRLAIQDLLDSNQISIF